MKSLFNRAQPVASFQLDSFDQPQTGRKNYVNKLQACCYQKNLAIATEKGDVYIYSISHNKVNYNLFTEPWVSSIENCRGNIWASGISRSLMCIRIKDNKKVFHTNTGTKFQGYIDKGLQILQEKVKRFFFYNSEHSKIRIMHSYPKKILIRPNLIAKEELEKYKEHRIDQFKVDDQKGHIVFTFKGDNHLFVYSYYERRLIQKIEIFSPALYKVTENVNMQFSCGNDSSSGLISALVSFVNAGGEQKNIFTLYNYDYTVKRFSKNFVSLLQNIKGEPKRMLFFRNCPPCDVVVITDNEGFVYIFKVTDTSVEFYEMIKQSSECGDIIAAHGCIVIASQDGKVDIFYIK